ncbi:MAG TPA: hypothetical protein VGB71_12695 [Flavisolibacter sp.]
MKILLFLSLLCTDLQPGVDTTKTEPKKKTNQPSKPQPKKSKSALPFTPFIIVDNY